jgi:retron-type reverse transcriptase
MGLFRWLLRVFMGGPSSREWVSVESLQEFQNFEANLTLRQPNRAETQTQTQARSQPQSRALKPVDAGQFSPLTRDEALKQARKLGFRFAFFGMRDVIPPATDPRTQLIDRAMVGQGLISSEELAELHTLGDAMLRLRPDLGGAALLAKEAVEQSQEERARRKKQKQAESAERKKKHAAAVARRRATDIMFLGRGVSKGLADRRSHVEKLTQRGLPVLSTPADVAAALDVSIPRLRWLAFHHPAARVTHYTNFKVPKKSGGERTLSAPKREIRTCQEWILENVLSRIEVHPAAHGFVPSHSTLTNAQPHVGHDVVLNTDLEEFFPSITFFRVQGVFESFGYSPAVAAIFALLCTESPRRTVNYNGTMLHVAAGERALPQGACTSPALSNLVARRLDSRLNGIANKLGWTYTRYADDCTFSASGEAGTKVGYLLARIRHISQDESFRVNEKKTRVLRRNARQSVTGINVNDGTTLPRKARRRLRAILHQAQRSGLQSQNRNGHPNYSAWLDGMIAYVSMVQPALGQKLRLQYEEAERRG